MITKFSASELPGAGVVEKGRTLENDLPGTKTFVKPVEDIRKPEPKDESIFRVDSPDTKNKSQTTPDINESNADKHFDIGVYGKAPWDSTTKTKYPYRDGIRNTHFAATKIINRYMRMICRNMK